MGDKKKVVQTTVGMTVPRRGNALTQKFARGILSILGWSIQGEVPDKPQFIVIGAPHTSNWDWLLVMATAYALGVRISWMMKHTAFRGPLKPFFTWLGGVAVDRRAANGIVGDSVNRFQEYEKLILCITPEGTRSKVKEWKTGFYHIAQGANIPIVPAVFDYGRKQVRFAPTLFPSGDLTGDLATLQTYYVGAIPKNRHSS